MRSFLVFAVLLAIVPVSRAQRNPEQRLIEAARQVPAKALDPALPRMSLGSWLESLVAQSSPPDWEVNDCGEQDGSPRDASQDFPACAEAVLTIGPGAKAHVSVMVGTVKRGVVGEPALFQLYIERGERYKELKRLSELPALVGDAQSRSR